MQDLLDEVALQWPTSGLMRSIVVFHSGIWPQHRDDAVEVQFDEKQEEMDTDITLHKIDEIFFGACCTLVYL